MITLSGKLVVRVSNGHNGKSFKEGLLKCSLGRFRVKYSQLESLQPGEYDGFFTMTKIVPHCLNHQGRFLLELEALIEKMAFITQPQEEPLENKPYVQQSLLSSADTVAEDNPQIEVSINIQSSQEVPEAEDEDEKLFGALYPLNREVTLDVTLDRKILRQQVSRLKEMGYTFDDKHQQWICSENISASL